MLLDFLLFGDQHSKQVSHQLSPLYQELERNQTRRWKDLLASSLKNLKWKDMRTMGNLGLCPLLEGLSYIFHNGSSSKMITFEM